MSVYELVVIIDGKSTTAKKKTAEELVQKLVSTAKGKILKKEDWGVIDFAYKIDGKSSGIYLYFELELTGNHVSGLESKLNFEKSIARSLIVRK